MSSTLSPGVRRSPSNHSYVLSPISSPCLCLPPNSSLNFELIILLLLFRKGSSPFYIFLTNMLFSFLVLSFIKMGHTCFCLGHTFHRGIFHCVNSAFFFCQRPGLQVFCYYNTEQMYRQCTCLLLYISISLGLKTQMLNLYVHLSVCVSEKSLGENTIPFIVFWLICIFSRIPSGASVGSPSLSCRHQGELCTWTEKAGEGTISGLCRAKLSGSLFNQVIAINLKCTD